MFIEEGSWESCLLGYWPTALLWQEMIFGTPGVHDNRANVDLLFCFVFVMVLVVVVWNFFVFSCFLLYFLKTALCFPPGISHFLLHWGSSFSNNHTLYFALIKRTISKLVSPHYRSVTWFIHNSIKPRLKNAPKFLNKELVIQTGLSLVQGKGISWVSNIFFHLTCIMGIFPCQYV